MYTSSSTMAGATLNTASEWRLGSPCQPGMDGMRNSSTAPRTSARCCQSDRRSSRAPSTPKTRAAPRTSRMFDTMLPATDPRTTFGRPSATAINAMISSGALPKLAFKIPPIRGPVCSAACSVASPISHASGTSATADRTKSAASPGCVAASTISVSGASASEAQSSRRATGAYPSGVLDAVLFDWGHTLMDFVWDDDLVEAGVRAGLAAVGAPGEAVQAVADQYRAEARLSDWEVPEELEYTPLVRRLLSNAGVLVDDSELERYLLAEHEAWAPARRPASMSQALLDALRDRGLKTGLVSNTMEPRWLLLRDLAEQRLDERLDVVVFSSDLGIRKPRPEIFLRALDELRVAPERVLFVGDRLDADVRGARAVGMRTVQAMWYRAEEDVDGVEPDFRAFTQFDVLNIVRRVVGEI